MREYAWHEATRFSADANRIGAELERLRASGQRLTAESIVEAAKAKRSPLHHLIFDGTTAEEALTEYRLEKARLLLRSIYIVQGESQTLDVRGFQILTVDGEREYVPADEVAADAAMSGQVRERLIRQMRALQRQLRAWDEFLPIALAIEEALAA